MPSETRLDTLCDDPSAGPNLPQSKRDLLFRVPLLQGVLASFLGARIY